MFRTRHQQKKICSHCPLAKVANIVGDSVVLVIIRDLLAGPKRYTELLGSLAGVSSRTLTLKLKLLEEKGLISHSDRDGSPAYSLTHKGAAIKASINALTEYGTQHL